MSVANVNSIFNTLPASTSSAPSTNTTTDSTTGSQLGFNDLLHIIVTQLSQQDPSKAASTTDLVNQYMSIANLQSSTTLKTNSDNQVAQERQIYAANLVGKNVTTLDSNNNTVTGVVQSSRVSGTSVLYTINGIEYDSNNIQSYLQ